MIRPLRKKEVNKGDIVKCNPFVVGETFYYSSSTSDTLIMQPSMLFNGDGKVLDFVKHAIHVEYTDSKGHKKYNYYTRDMLIVEGVDYE